MSDTRTPAPPTAGRPRRRGAVVVVALAALVVAAVVAVAAILLERNRTMPDVAEPGTTGPGATASLSTTAPTTDELTVAGHARVLFGHQSVGDNILGGIAAVFEQAEVAPPQIVETREPVTGSDGFIAHTYVGANGDPLGKLADFVALTNGPLGDDVDILLLKLCYVDITASTDVQALFDAYAAAMDEIQVAHPDTVVLYATAPLTADRSGGVKAMVKSLLGRGATDVADNTARAQYNALVREAFGDSGRLFDIAAVEAVPGSDPAALDPELTWDGGHLNEAGAQAAARELLRVVAANAAGPATTNPAG